MSLKEQLQADIKSALLSGDKEKTSILRVLKSVILQAEVDQGKREEGLSDQEIMKLLAKEQKKRLEAATMYKEAGESERAAAEEKEAELIDSYLPKQMSDTELKALVEEVVDELNITDLQPKDMGKVIGIANAKAQGRADGSRIASTVKSLIK